MDKQIKAMFREDARRIVSRDRGARKHGNSNNLPGEITTALVTAYELGLEYGRDPSKKKSQLLSSEEAIAWELIPPTSRNVLTELTFSYSQRGREPTFTSSELKQYVDQATGRKRWLVVEGEGEPCVTDHSFAGKGIGPLLRMELLALKDGCEERLALTHKGDAACRLYWARSDRDDPTLPIESMR